MAVNKKSNSVIPVSREGLGFTLTSANQDAYPVAYSDDIWSIVKQGSKISAVIGEASVEDGCICVCPNESGTYTLFDIIEAISNYAIQTAIDLSLALAPGGAVDTKITEKVDSLDSIVSASTRNFGVEIEQVDGLITRVSIDIPDLDAMYDAIGSADAVLGDGSDTYTKHTVYGAFAAISKLNNDFTEAIRALDSEVEDEDNGVSVRIEENNGILTKVVVSNSLLGTSTDSPDKNTIYGVRNFAKQVLGSDTDTKDVHSVYGAFAFITYVKNQLDEFKASRIPDSKIRALFCQ